MKSENTTFREVKIEDSSDTVRIQIKELVDPVIAIALGFMLFVLACVDYLLISAFIGGDPIPYKGGGVPAASDQLRMIGGSSALLLLFAFVFVLMLAGSEVLTITVNQVIYRREIFGRAISVKRIQASDIRGFRLANLRKKRIDYLALQLLTPKREVTFARHISMREAEKVLAGLERFGRDMLGWKVLDPYIQPRVWRWSKT